MPATVTATASPPSPPTPTARNGERNNLAIAGSDSSPVTRLVSVMPTWTPATGLTPAPGWDHR